jgi:hypothetical protein
VSLRGQPVEKEAKLPDGTLVLVRVSLASDAYVPRRELHTVTLELLADGRVEATVNTVLDAAQVREARKLVDEVTTRLESGDLEPTAAAIEPLADSIL